MLRTQTEAGRMLLANPEAERYPPWGGRTLTRTLSLTQSLSLTQHGCSTEPAPLPAQRDGTEGCGQRDTGQRDTPGHCGAQHGQQASAAQGWVAPSSAGFRLCPSLAGTAGLAWLQVAMLGCQPWLRNFLLVRQRGAPGVPWKPLQFHTAPPAPFPSQPSVAGCVSGPENHRQIIFSPACCRLRAEAHSPCA